MSTAATLITGQPAPFKSLWADALAGDLAALSTLAPRCAVPVYAWLRASGAAPEDAEHGTAGFFAWLRAEAPPTGEDAEISRLGDFLIHRLTRYEEAGFPAGAASEFTFDAARAERRFAREPVRPADEIFAHRWSLTIIENTLEKLRQEFAAQGKTALLAKIQPFLNFSGVDDERYADLADELTLSVSALHMAVFRMRQRYREVLREFISDTVRAADEVDGELTLLLCAAS